MQQKKPFNPSVFSKLSHDIRTPVAIILGMVRFLEKTSLTDQQKIYVRYLTESAQSLLGLDQKIAQIIENNKL